MRRRSEELDLDRYDTDKVPNGYLRITGPSIGIGR